MPDLLEVFEFDTVLGAKLTLKAAEQLGVLPFFVEELFAEIEHFGVDRIVTQYLTPCDVFQLIGDDFHFGDGGVDDETEELRQNDALLGGCPRKRNSVVVDRQKITTGIDGLLPIEIQLKIERLVLLELELASQSFVI